MIPYDTYGLFECREEMHRVRCKKAFYCFDIDKWLKLVKFCVLERKIRHDRIKTSQEIIVACIAAQERISPKTGFPSMLRCGDGSKNMLL